MGKCWWRRHGQAVAVLAFARVTIVKTRGTPTSDWSWLISITSGQHARIIVGALLTVLGAGLGICDPLLMKALLDTALPRRDLRLAIILVALTALVLLGRPYLAGSGLVITYRAFLESAHELRIALLRHISRLSIDYHEQTPAGDKLSRIEQDVTAIGDFGPDVLSGCLRAAVLFLLNCGAVLTISPMVGIFLVVAIPGFAFFDKILKARLCVSANRVQTATGNSTASVAEFLAFIPDLQLLNAEHLGSKRVTAFWRARRDAQAQLKKIEALFGIGTGSVISCALMATLAAGSIQVTRGRLSIGGLIAIFTFANRLFDPVGAAMELYSHIQRMRVSVTRVRSAMSVAPTVEDRASALLVTTSTVPHIEIARLFYAYPRSRIVLRDISLHINASERVVIAGKSGSGKSTLARLLVRFGDPDRGDIRLAGRSISEYPLTELRRSITYVPQRPAIFSGTIAENLHYGNDRASIDELKSALETAQFSPVLAKAREGLDTLLGPGGVTLSGGEAQRLVLARALLKRSRVLILDESTSALDLPTESAIFANLLQFRPGTTLIVISHRLSSLASWADKILLLDDGAVVAEGRHNVLYAQVPAYRKLFDSSSDDDAILYRQCSAGSAVAGTWPHVPHQPGVRGQQPGSVSQSPDLAFTMCKGGENGQ